jgi:hypothetical protein
MGNCRYTVAAALLLTGAVLFFLIISDGIRVLSLGS